MGELQEDTQSDMLAETLHPCGLCREKLAASEHVDADKILIASALPDLSVIELYTLNALKHFHATEDPSGIYKVHIPNAQEMELLKPFVPSDASRAYVLEDTPQVQREEWI